MTSLSAPAALAGRLMLVAIFLIEGWSKIDGYAGAAAYMRKFGMPEALLLPAIAIEIVGSLLIAVGWQTRLAAFVLAGFCVATAVLFHTNLAIKNEALHFWKDIGLAGGFLLLVAHGPGRWSLDQRSRPSRDAS